MNLSPAEIARLLVTWDRRHIMWELLKPFALKLLAMVAQLILDNAPRGAGHDTATAKCEDLKKCIESL